MVLTVLGVGLNLVNVITLFMLLGSALDPALQRQRGFTVRALLTFALLFVAATRLHTAATMTQVAVAGVFAGFALTSASRLTLASKTA